MLLRTRLFWQLTLMPSAHSWNASVPHGPISLFCTVTLLHDNAPSDMWRHDQLRGSKDRTNSISWFALEPPISMFAPPMVGGAPALVPLICVTKKIRNASHTKRKPVIVSSYLHVSQFNTTAILTGTVNRRGMSLTISHRTSNYECRSVVPHRVSNGADFLVRGREHQGGLDEVLHPRTQRKGVSLPRPIEQRVKPVCKRI